MKLFEIKGFDKGVKVRRKVWEKTFYITYNGECFIDSFGKAFFVPQVSVINNDDWEVYREELKKTKRYWLWNINAGFGWMKSIYYVDDDGYYTNGIRSSDWDKNTKQKLENEYIDVEVL